VIYGLSNVSVTFGPRREEIPREPADPADFARASLEARGWRIVDAEQAQRAAPEKIRIPPAELRYRGLRPGDRVKIVARRLGGAEDAFWCWVQILRPGDHPRLVVTLDGEPLAADAHGLLWGDALTVHPREVFAVERCPDAGPDLCGPEPMNS